MMTNRNMHLVIYDDGYDYSITEFTDWTKAVLEYERIREHARRSWLCTVVDSTNDARERAMASEDQ